MTLVLTQVFGAIAIMVAAAALILFYRAYRAGNSEVR